MGTTIKDKYRVTPLSGIAYSLPVVPMLILMSTNNVLGGIYATYHGLSLAAIAMVMLVANLFDAVSDPSIGYLSDRYHARTGSRQPFVICGAILSIPCAWYLLNPGEGVTITYFFIWYILFYLAMTLFQIPHTTWGGEMSPISEQKIKVYAYRSYCTYAGIILFALVPMLPFIEGTRVTPEVMRYLVIIAAIILLPTLYIMYRYVPSGAHRVDQTRNPENPFRAMKALGHNKPLLGLLITTALNNMALAFFIGVLFMAMDTYLGLGEYFVHFVLFNLVMTTLAVKPATKLMARIGKIKAWAISLKVMAFSFMFLSLALLNNAYTLYFLVIFYTMYSFSSAVYNVAMYSLLSDISDYGTLKSGVDRSATSFSAQSLASKTCLAMGISLSIGLVSLFGFDPAAEPPSQGPQIYWGLTVCMSIIPTVLFLIASAIIPRVTITEQRHAIIRRRLDLRMARAAHIDAIPG